MTKDKALEIAIEWMEGLIQYLPSTKEHKATMSRYNKAITAIKEVLAQPEQEPVAWKLMPRDATDAMLKAMDGCSTEGYDERLYAGHAASVYMAAWDALDTHPPQRTWVGLTDGEMEDTFIQCGGKWNGDFWRIEDADFHPFLRSIEAKLKDKNCAG